MHPAMQLLPGGAKLILCTTKPEAENPVRTNESRTSNNFWVFFNKKRVVNTHTDIGIIATHHHNDRQTNDRQSAADVDTSLQEKAESKQIGRRIGSRICQIILECDWSMNL